MNSKNEYNIIISENDIYKYPGDNLIKVRANEILILLDQYKQVCLALGYSLFNIEYEFTPQQISIKDTIKHKITEKDLYGNIISDPLYDDISIGLTYGG